MDVSLSNVFERRVLAYLEFWPDFWDIAKIDSAVVNPEELMYHGLVRPLRQKRRDRVVPAIYQQQYRRRIRPPEIK